ncbi:MAG TPA: hypothetical protein VFV43_11700 [Limnobacter sp.]|nr:hypothetical protein [Limnobacter sp.]
MIQLEGVEALGFQVNANEPLESSITVLDPEIKLFAGGQQPILSIDDLNVLNKASASSVRSDLSSLDRDSVHSPDTSNSGNEGISLRGANIDAGSTLEVRNASFELTRNTLAVSFQDIGQALRRTFNEDGLNVDPGIEVDNLTLNPGDNPLTLDVRPGEPSAPSEGEIVIPTLEVPQLAPISDPVGNSLQNTLGMLATAIKDSTPPRVSVVEALREPDRQAATTTVFLGSFALKELGFVFQDASTTQRQFADVIVSSINNSKEKDMTAVIFNRVNQGAGGDNIATRAATSAGVLAENLREINPQGYAPTPPEGGGDPVEQSPEQQFASDMQAAFEAGNPANGGNPQDGFAAGANTVQNFAGQIFDDTAGVAVQLAEASPSLAVDAVGNVDGEDEGEDPSTDFGTFVNGSDDEDGFDGSNAFEDMDVIGSDNDVLTIADGVLGFPADLVAAAAGGGEGGGGPAPSLVKGLVPADAAFASAIVEGVERAFTGVDEGLGLFASEYNAGTTAFLTSVENQSPDAGEAFLQSRAPGGQDELAPKIDAIAEGEAYDADESNAAFIQDTLQGAPEVIVASLQSGGAPVGGDEDEGGDEPGPFETVGTQADDIVSQDPTPISSSAGYQEGDFAMGGAMIDQMLPM